MRRFEIEGDYFVFSGMDFGVHLKKTRIASGRTQADLAKESGITPSAISLLEGGDREPWLSTAIRIADALGVSVYSLIGREEIQREEAGRINELAKTKKKLNKIRDICNKL